jgi:uncharacterized phage-associated protein
VGWVKPSFRCATFQWLTKNVRELERYAFVWRHNHAYIPFVPDLIAQFTNISFREDMGKMTYTPQHIANYVLHRGKKEGISLSPMKLLKLVYIAYGWNLALTGKKLFDEPIQAWKHGPVIESLYHEFKHFRSDPITDFAIKFDLDSGDAVVPEVTKDDLDTNLILDKVWASYSKFSGSTLRAKTHEPDTPWSKVYEPGTYGIYLKDDDIAAHYQERIERYIKAAH